MPHPAALDEPDASYQLQFEMFYITHWQNLESGNGTVQSRDSALAQHNLEFFGPHQDQEINRLVMVLKVASG